MTPELKKWITNNAIGEKKTVSNYLRDHLTSFMNGSLFEKAVAFYEEREFYNSTAFLQLVAFVFSKRNDGKSNETEEQLDSYIRTIKRLENKAVPREIIEEFDKVLVDLIRIKKKGVTSFSRHFEFCETLYSNPDRFDYKRLEDFLLNVLKPYHKVVVNK